MSPWCPYSEPGSTVPPNTFRRHFVIRQQYTHFTHFIIINNLHLHDTDSVGSLTSVRLTLRVHSMANSVKNAGAVIRVGRNAQAEEPMLERFSRSDWLKWLPLGIGGCGRLRIKDVTDSGLIICSRHSDSVDGAKKSKLEKNMKGLWVGREGISISRHTPLSERRLEQVTRSEPRSNFIN